MATLLDDLRTPWASPRKEVVGVNHCLQHALSKATDVSRDWISCDLAPNLPNVEASEEILVEIFRGIIKNAVESLAEKGDKKYLWIESHQKDKGFIRSIFATPAQVSNLKSWVRSLTYFGLQSLGELAWACFGRVIILKGWVARWS